MKNSEVLLLTLITLSSNIKKHSLKAHIVRKKGTIMTPLYAFTFIIFIISLGNMLAVKTRSIVSMLFSVSIFFLIAFSLGLPRTIFADSTLQALGQMLIPILLVHIGSSMNIQQLKEQWRTVVIALAAIVGIVIFVIFVGQFFVGLEAAMVASAPIAGGVVGGIQMGEAATAIGLPELSIFASLLVVVQGFIGYPIASFALKKEGLKVREAYRAGTLSGTTGEEPRIVTEEKRLDIPNKYKSDEWYLAKAALIASIALFISQTVVNLTGYNYLDTNVLALILGVFAHHFGLIEEAPLNKSNSYGLAMASLTVVILGSLATATPDVLLELLPMIVITLLLGAVGIIIFSLLASKFLNVSLWMGIGIGISALFGFPGTFIVPNEVANSIGENDAEIEAIREEIQPKMLVAGFVTVSIASVVLAGILSSILVTLQ